MKRKVLKLIKNVSDKYNERYIAPERKKWNVENERTKEFRKLKNANLRFLQEAREN